MAERYRPSNGTEGAGFLSKWCCNCERDKDEDCPIVAATFTYEADDPKYPPEWCFDADGNPHCTAFVEFGNPLAYRCPDTPDMFPGEEPSNG